MMNIYYITVKVLGDPIDEEDLIPKKEKITMEVIELQTNSSG